MLIEIEEMEIATLSLVNIFANDTTKLSHCYMDVFDFKARSIKEIDELIARPIRRGLQVIEGLTRYIIIVTGRYYLVQKKMHSG